VLVRAGSNRPGTWAIVGLTLVAGSLNWTERPNLFSYLFFAITLAWVLRRDRRVWLFVPLAMLWANMHAMVLLGLGLVFLVAIVEWLKVALRWEGSDTAWAKRLSIVGGGATLAAMVNPFGPALFGHSFFLVRVVERFNTEWASPNFHAVVPLVFLALVVIAVAGIALSDRRADPTDVALLLAFVSLGLFARRNMLLSAIVAGYVAARYAPAALDVALARRGGAREPAGRIPVPLSLVVFAALVAFGVAAVATQFPRSGSLADTLEPTQPVALVRSLPAGDVRLFARDYWAGFALWTRWPDVRVAFDGRVDLYGFDVQDAYVGASDAEPGWDRYLDEVCATHVLMPESAGLHAALDGQNAWTRIGTEVVRVPNALSQERLAVLWERRIPARGCAGT
jgi:hypothetical protein